MSSCCLPASLVLKADRIIVDATIAGNRPHARSRLKPLLQWFSLDISVYLIPSFQRSQESKSGRCQSAGDGRSCCDPPRRRAAWQNLILEIQESRMSGSSLRSQPDLHLRGIKFVSHGYSIGCRRLPTNNNVFPLRPLRHCGEHLLWFLSLPCSV